MGAIVRIILAGIQAALGKATPGMKTSEFLVLVFVTVGVGLLAHYGIEVKPEQADVMVAATIAFATVVTSVYMSVRGKVKVAQEEGKNFAASAREAEEIGSDTAPESVVTREMKSEDE